MHEKGHDRELKLLKPGMDMDDKWSKQVMEFSYAPLFVDSVGHAGDVICIVTPRLICISQNHVTRLAANACDDGRDKGRAYRDKPRVVFHHLLPEKADEDLPNGL